VYKNLNDERVISLRKANKREQGKYDQQNSNASKSITDKNGDVGTLPNEFFDKAVRGEPKPNDQMNTGRGRSIPSSQVTAKPIAKSALKAKSKNLASS